MDNLTHTLIGVTLANAGVKQKFGRGTTLVLAVASNLPDIDVLAPMLFKGEYFMLRRMLTHSVVGIPLLALGSALLFRIFFKEQSFRNLFALSFAGVALHVLFDLFNSFGVVVLYPFSRARFELGCLFIVDLAILTILFFPLLVRLFSNDADRFRRMSQGAFAALCAYVLLCAGARLRSNALATTWAAATPNTNVIAVFPEALGPQRFRGVARQGDTYHQAFLYPFTGRVAPLADQETLDRDPSAEKARNSFMGQQMEWFFKAPVWLPEATDKPGTELWDVYDLRFVSGVIHRGTPFRERFEVSADNVKFLGRAR